MCSHIRTRLDSLPEMTSLDAVSFPGLYSKYFNIIFKINTFILYIYYYIFSLSIYNSVSQCQAPSLIATVPCLCQLSQPQVMAFSTALWDAFRSATQRASELRCNQSESLNCRSFIKSWICCDWQKKNNSRLEVKPPNTYGTAKDSFGGFPKCVIGHLFPSPADCQADARSDSF